MESLELFNVKGYLEDKGIAYATSGDNISAGWIGINCPKCGDTVHHFGINLHNKLYSCWCCGTRGNPFTLVRMIEGIDDSSAIHAILKQYMTGERYFAPEKEEVQSLALPSWFINMEAWYKESEKYTQEEWSLQSEKLAPCFVLNYLMARGYDPQETIKKYKLMWGGILGAFAFRMLIPVFMNGVMVNFAGRATHGQDPPYKNCPNARAPMSINDTLYGYDEVGEGETIVLCEGPLDKWRLGLGAMATFGLVLTTAQAGLLYKKKPKKLVFIYDEDVREDPEKLTVVDKSLAKIWFCDCETFILTKGDPDSMNPWEATKLMEGLRRG